MQWDGNPMTTFDAASPKAKRRSLACRPFLTSKVELSTGPKATRIKHANSSTGVSSNPKRETSSSKCWAAWGTAVLSRDYMRTRSSPATRPSRINPWGFILGAHAGAGQPRRPHPKQPPAPKLPPHIPAKILTQNQGLRSAAVCRGLHPNPPPPDRATSGHELQTSGGFVTNKIK